MYLDIHFHFYTCSNTLAQLILNNHKETLHPIVSGVVSFAPRGGFMSGRVTEAADRGRIRICPTMSRLNAIANIW